MVYWWFPSGKDWMCHRANIRHSFSLQRKQTNLHSDGRGKRFTCIVEVFTPKYPSCALHGPS